MSEHFEYFDLSHGGFFDDLIFLGFFELFDGYYFFILIALAFEYDSVGSFSNESHNVIFLHVKFITII